MEGTHTFSLTTIMRQNKSNKDGTPVYLRITCNNERAEASVKIYVDPNKWNIILLSHIASAQILNNV